MHHGLFPLLDGHLFAIGDENHLCDPSFGPSLAGYNPAGYSGVAKELVAGLDRFGRQLGLVDPHTVTEKGLAGWNPVGWDLVDPRTVTEKGLAG